MFSSGINFNKYFVTYFESKLTYEFFDYFYSCYTGSFAIFFL